MMMMTMMMKTLTKSSLVVAGMILLAGCSPRANSVNFPLLPPELSDCKFFNIYAGELGTNLTVARCHNSTTTTVQNNGKTRKTTIVIDGVEYERKD